LAVAVWSPPAAALGEQVTVVIKGHDGKDLGTARLVETLAGVIISVKLKGLAPGPHGFHLHETGKCEGDFTSAGGIYNPLGAKHGFLNEEGPMAGDLTNLVAGADGTVESELLSPFVTLNKAAEESLYDADGASLVVFERGDDYQSEPEGNAGQRVGCGTLPAAG